MFIFISKFVLLDGNVISDIRGRAEQRYICGVEFFLINSEL